LFASATGALRAAHDASPRRRRTVSQPSFGARGSISNTRANLLRRASNTYVTGFNASSPKAVDNAGPRLVGRGAQGPGRTASVACARWRGARNVATVFSGFAPARSGARRLKVAGQAVGRSTLAGRAHQLRARLGAAP